MNNNGPFKLTQSVNLTDEISGWIIRISTLFKRMFQIYIYIYNKPGEPLVILYFFFSIKLFLAIQDLSFTKPLRHKNINLHTEYDEETPLKVFFQTAMVLWSTIFLTLSLQDSFFSEWFHYQSQWILLERPFKKAV